MKNLSEFDIIRAKSLANDITNHYDYISFADAWKDAKELHYSRDVFEAAYTEAENIWENK